MVDVQVSRPDGLRGKLADDGAVSLPGQQHCQSGPGQGVIGNDENTQGVQNIAPETHRD